MERIKREYTREKSTARTSKEALINEMTEDRQLRKLIAIAANTMKWSDTDLHALLKKKNDPAIRNYQAFLRWSIKTKK